MSCYDFDAAFRCVDHDLNDCKTELAEVRAELSAARTEIWLLHEEIKELRLTLGFPDSKTSALHNLTKIAKGALGE